MRKKKLTQSKHYKKNYTFVSANLIIKICTQ